MHPRETNIPMHDRDVVSVSKISKAIFVERDSTTVSRELPLDKKVNSVGVEREEKKGGQLENSIHTIGGGRHR